MKYLLDTDVIILYLKGDQNAVAEIQKLIDEELFTSMINFAELVYGVYNSDNPERTAKPLNDFLEHVQIVQIDTFVCELFGKLKSDLRKQGNILDNFDLMIAAAALADNMTLITRNKNHFERITELKLKII